MRRCSPDTLPLCRGAQLRDALQSQQPITESRLWLETVQCESVANAVKHSLSVLKHQVRSLSRATSTPLSRCSLRKSATNGQAPEPITQVLVLNAKDWLKDGNAHQRRRKCDSLKRDRTELVVIEWHVREETPNNNSTPYTHSLNPQKAVSQACNDFAPWHFIPQSKAQIP
jgi:hypothetical protein